MEVPQIHSIAKRRRHRRGSWFAYVGFFSSLAACSGNGTRSTTLSDGGSIAEAAAEPPGPLDATMGSAVGAHDMNDGGRPPAPDAGDASTDASDASDSAVKTDDSIIVDPVHGDDGNNGDRRNPLKTLKRALKLAQSGQTVQLLSGVYGSKNGDEFPAEVPAGVTIEGAAGQHPVLDGTGLPPPMDDTLMAGLLFSADGSAKNLTISHLERGIAVSHGVVTLSALELSQNNVGLLIYGDAKVDAKGLDIHDDLQDAVDVADASKLTLSDATISNLGLTECGGAAGVYAYGVVDVQLTRVAMSNILGEAVSIRGFATARLIDCHIEHAGLVKCGTEAVVDASEQASLSMTGTTIDSPRDPSDTLVFLQTSKIFDCSGNSFSGASAGVALDVHVSGANISATTFSDNEVGVALSGSQATKLEFCSFSGNSLTDLDVKSQQTRARQCQFESASKTSIKVSQDADIDLGTSADPGGNYFQGMSDVGLSIEDQKTLLSVSAAGNWWRADQFGLHSVNARVTGPSCASDGKGNYCIGHNVILNF